MTGRSPLRRPAFPVIAANIAGYLAVLEASFSWSRDERIVSRDEGPGPAPAVCGRAAVSTGPRR